MVLVAGLVVPGFEKEACRVYNASGVKLPLRWDNRTAARHDQPQTLWRPALCGALHS